MDTHFSRKLIYISYLESSFWSFTLKRKALLDARPKPHAANFHRFQLKTAVLVYGAVFKRHVFGKAWFSKTVPVENYDFFSTQNTQIRKNRVFLCETKDHLPRKITPIFGFLCRDYYCINTHVPVFPCGLRKVLKLVTVS